MTDGRQGTKPNIHEQLTASSLELLHEADQNRIMNVTFTPDGRFPEGLASANWFE